MTIKYLDRNGNEIDPPEFDEVSGTLAKTNYDCPTIWYYDDGSKFLQWDDGRTEWIE